MSQQYFKTLLTGALFLVLGALLPAHGTSIRVSSGHLSSDFTFEDFDGDRKVDVAEVEAAQGNRRDSRYWIALQLSSGPRQELRISAPLGGLLIMARDVNADHFPDLVITARWTNLPVAVLLNDGQGRFRATPAANFPQVFSDTRDQQKILSVEVCDLVSAFLIPDSYPDCALPQVRALLHCPESRFWQQDFLGASIANWCSILGRAPPFIAS